MHTAPSPHEELANAASHLLGCLLALAAAPALLQAAASRDGRGGAAAAALFCATMLLQYAASVACHACPPGRLKPRLRALDHAAIFLFIAGSLTPFAVGTGRAGVCTAVWLIALAGAVLKLAGRLTERRRSTALYLLLGAGALAAVAPALPALAAGALVWLGAGVAAYLLGVVFFLADARLRFGHLVWHLFVLAGSACHLRALLLATPALAPA